MISPNPIAPPESRDDTADITVQMWSELDPKFDDKFEAAFESIWLETLLAQFNSRSTYFHTASTQPMEKVLEGLLKKETEASPQPEWIRDWQREQANGMDEE